MRFFARTHWVQSTTRLGTGNESVLANPLLGTEKKPSVCDFLLSSREVNVLLDTLSWFPQMEQADLRACKRL